MPSPDDTGYVKKVIDLLASRIVEEARGDLEEEDCQAKLLDLASQGGRTAGGTTKLT